MDYRMCFQRKEICSHFFAKLVVNNLNVLYRMLTFGLYFNDRI